MMSSVDGDTSVCDVLPGICLGDGDVLIGTYKADDKHRYPSLVFVQAPERLRVGSFHDVSLAESKILGIIEVQSIESLSALERAVSALRTHVQNYEANSNKEQQTFIEELTNV